MCKKTEKKHQTDPIIIFLSVSFISKTAGITGLLWEQLYLYLPAFFLCARFNECGNVESVFFFFFLSLHFQEVLAHTSYILRTSSVPDITTPGP